MPYPQLKSQKFTFEDVFGEDTSKVSDYKATLRQALPKEQQEFQQGVPWGHEESPSENINSQHGELAINTANLTNSYSLKKNVLENTILVKRHNFRFNNVHYCCVVLTPPGEITKHLSEQ